MNKRKYRNKPVVIDNIKFDSMKEGRRYQDLKLLERGKVITDLELQPKYDLMVNGKKCGFYKADFRYQENGKTVIEDCKGFKTPVYNLKKKLVQAIYDIKILET